MCAAQERPIASGSLLHIGERVRKGWRPGMAAAGAVLILGLFGVLLMPTTYVAESQFYVSPGPHGKISSGSLERVARFNAESQRQMALTVGRSEIAVRNLPARFGVSRVRGSYLLDLKCFSDSAAQAKECMTSMTRALDRSLESLRQRAGDLEAVSQGRQAETNGDVVYVESIRRVWLACGLILACDVLVFFWIATFVGGRRMARR